MSAHWEITPIAVECGSGRHMPGAERLPAGTAVCRIAGGRLVRCRTCAERQGYPFDAPAIAAAQAVAAVGQLAHAAQPSMLPEATYQPPAGAGHVPLVRSRRRRQPAPAPTRPAFDPRRAAANDYD